MPNSKKLMPLLILTSIGLAACGTTIKRYDTEVCSDLGKYGARCNHTLIEKPRTIPKEQWDEERFGMFCMSSQAFNDTETAIDQFCAAYQGVCDNETRDAIKKTMKRMRRLKIRNKKRAV